MNELNKSGLHPLGRCVLVQPYEPKRPDSVIVLSDGAIAEGHMLEMRAIVIEVGSHCWPEEPPRARPGDLVMIAKMSGSRVKGPKDGQWYRAINDKDIFIRIEEQS